MSSLGNLYFKIGADVKAATTAINSVERQIAGLSKNFGSLGKVFFSGLSAAGILELGKQALVASSQFEKAFLKIKNLTDSSTQDIVRYKAELSKISSTIGVSLNDLADGLYTITSAGASGSRAIETLGIASKAAAVGMGSVEDVSKALTATINAYGEENLSAAKAAEIFFKTTKSGSLDVKELTNSMSNVTPLAAALGVNLEQVGAFLATVSLKGTAASEAVTQLASIMNAIINPSTEAKKVMDAIGLSMDELQAMVKTDFRGAMLELEKRFEGSAEAMAKFFGRKEAVIGFLSVTGDAAKKYGQILADNTKDTTLLEAATKDALDTIEGRWNKAVAVWGNALKILGDILATTTLIAVEKVSYLDEAAGIEKVNEAIRQQRRDVIALISEKNKLTNRFASGNTYGVLGAPGGPTAQGLVNPLTGPKIDDTQIDKYSKLRAEIDKLFSTNEKVGKGTKTLNSIIREQNQLLESWDAFTSNLVKEQEELNLLLLDQNALSKANTQAILDNVKAKQAQALIDARLNAQQRDKTRAPISGLGPSEGESIPEIIKGLSSSQIESLGNIFQTEGVEAYKAALSDVNTGMEQTKEILTGIGTQAAQAFAGLSLSLIDGSLAFKDLGRAALDAADQIVKAALASAIAAAITGSLKNPNILVGLALAAVAISVVKRLFKTNVPKLAGGGLAYRPQLAVVGDNPNAASDPEVISPLSKLNSLLANQINNLAGLLTRSFNQSIQAVFAQPTAITQPTSLDFRDPLEIVVKGKIDGSDIRLAYDRAESIRNRHLPKPR